MAAISSTSYRFSRSETMSENALLQPGVSIKPRLTRTDVEQTLIEVYTLKCVEIRELNGYDDNNYHVHVEKTADNPFIDNPNSTGYILKIVNSLDSQRPQIFEAQTEILLHLGKKGICCPKPVKDITGKYWCIRNFASGIHLVRLLEYIDANILYQVPASNHLFYEAGQYVAKLNDALKDFHHDAYNDHKSVWQLQSVPQLSQFLYVVTDGHKKQIIEGVIKEFEQRVLAIDNQLEKGMIHGDFNEQNILVEKETGDWSVKGILDFGDCHYACYIFELAITMTYMMIQGNCVEVGRHVLAGYNSVRKLTREEYNILRICILGRLCQSLVLGAYSSRLDPENEYLLVTARSGWKLLEELWTRNDEELLQIWGNS